MIITILGSGCPNCQLLEQNVKKAVEELNLQDKIQVDHIYDIEKIIEMGIALTPALAIDGKVQSEGHILSVEEITKLINNNLNK